LRRDLAKIDIGVSLLCPGNVRTQIDHSGRNRPDELGGPEETPAEFLAARAHRTIPPNEPEEVGEWVVQAIKNNEEFIVMNPERRAAVAGRLDALLAAYERAQ
jgi:short-subunit dehydrogenase